LVDEAFHSVGDMLKNMK